MAVSLFILLSLFGSLASDGFLEADGCTHYLYARYAFHEPQYLFNIWGRPVCTAVYAIGAQLAGRFGVRCISLAMAVSTAFIARTIAAKQRDRSSASWLALIVTLVQPLFFLHSFSELTELPFTLLLGLTFLAFQSKRWFTMAIIASFLPMTRPEGFAIYLLAVVAIVIRREWLVLLCMPVTFIVWNYCGWVTSGSPPDYPWYAWLVHNWPYAEKSAYETRSIFHFVMLMPAIISPLLFPGLLVGILIGVANLRRTIVSSTTRLVSNHRLHCEAVILFLPLMILAGHSFLTATGRMASSGELRYMLVVSPFWAILTARGWNWIFRWQRWPFPCAAALVAAMLPFLVNRAYVVLPLSYSDDWLAARRAADWIEHTPLRTRYPMLAACHPGLYYFLDFSPTDEARSLTFRRDKMLKPQDGAMLVWDWIYGTHNSSRDMIVPLDELEKAGWVRIDVPRVQAAKSAREMQIVLLSPRDAAGRPTSRPATISPTPEFGNK